MTIAIPVGSFPAKWLEELGLQSTRGVSLRTTPIGLFSANLTDQNGPDGVWFDDGVFKPISEPSNFERIAED